MTIKYLPAAEKQLAKLDKPIAKSIKKYMEEVSALENPRTRGKGLVGNRRGLWRYRVGDYRIICQIRDSELIIAVIDIGHRSEIYSSK